MQSSLMVIGINHHSAPVEVRERFWITGSRRADALANLSREDGIAEVMLLSSSQRTDFILWARDASTASGSVLNFLTREFGLQLNDWKHFYRKLDEPAVIHVFLAGSGIDSIQRERECGDEFKDAGVAALQAGTAGRFLDAVAQKALALAGPLREAASRGGPEAAEDLARCEAKKFYGKLLQERVVPTITALRQRIDDICVQELESFYQGLTTLSFEERELVEAFGARLTQRIEGMIAHELKDPSERTEQERLTNAVQRLFRLEIPQHATPAPSTPKSESVSAAKC